MQATLSSKGQATVPKAVREYLHLKPGDRFRFFLQPDGAVVILPLVPVSSLRGSIARRKEATSVEEMNAGIRTGAAKRVRR